MSNLSLYIDLAEAAGYAITVPQSIRQLSVVFVKQSATPPAGARLAEHFDNRDIRFWYKYDLDQIDSARAIVYFYVPAVLFECGLLEAMQDAFSYGWTRQRAQASRPIVDNTVFQFDDVLGGREVMVTVDEFEHDPSVGIHYAPVGLAAYDADTHMPIELTERDQERLEIRASELYIDFIYDDAL